MESPGDKAVIAVRSRPLFAQEIARNCASVLNFPDEDKNIVILGKHGFEFDKIFCGSAQEEVFEIVRPILKQVWAGYSATVMAYGQTGAGKTYTMGTGRGKFSLDGEGVVPRTVRELFMLNAEQSAEIFVSFMEVYNEGVYDLLSAFPTRKIQARAFRDLGLQEIHVVSVEDALKRLEEGIEARRVSETQGNEKSSRSHAIFSIHIHKFSKEDETETRSLVHLVDLAGSEAVGKAGNQGSLKLEGISINQGLLALSNCIRAVIQKSQHIPVRNTALTNVLQDALKGKCMLALIACVSPSSKDETETIQTLRFAQAFHKIKSKPHIQKIVAQHQHAKNHNKKILGLVTPNGLRKPFASIGNNSALQFPNVMTNYQFVTRRATVVSPTEFEHSSCSSTSRGNVSPVSNMSSASIFSHFSEHELNEYMSSIIVEKIAALKKETEALVNKRIEDALKNIGPQPTIAAENDSANLDLTVVTVSNEAFGGSSTPKRNKISNSCQTSPQSDADANKSTVFVTDLVPITPYVDHRAIRRSPTPDKSEEPPRKLRRSVRLSCMELPVFLRSQSSEGESHTDRRKLRRSLRLSCMDLPDFLRTKDEEDPKLRRSSRRSCVPKLEDFAADEVPAKRARYSVGGMSELRRPRRSTRLSTLNLPASEVPVPTEVQQESKKRKSVGPDILEEILFHESPSAGSVQEKHNRRMLELLNTETTKVLQQLPTVGPKTGYVIYSYRQIHGNYSSFDDLKNIPGLSANFLKRFLKANNIKVAPADS
ncbi:Hypothetical predicted protein [Cloeon dipterum]|uniref:Kinesin motor domain-containing protein n=3 Tax=Cloeon dipterum TaxID=197152 RepID=A0A8S1CLD7_9INSE|nr:Hypothetical predicted protein [Cloeon dipterum]